METGNQQKNNLEWALFYQSIGLNIIPVGTNKISLIKWEVYQSKCSTVEEIKRWWGQWPDANMAVMTGKISGIVALDLDVKHGRTSKEFQIPATICARSGNGGEHFFFKYPKNTHVKSRSAISGLGVDIRADGGYILLSPSINATGGIYEWTVPLESREDLAEMPEWLKKITTENLNEKKWLSGMDGVSEGARNDTSASMAGKILSSMDPKLWEILGWEQLKIWSQKCTPPLPEKELRSTWDSIKRLHVEGNGKMIDVGILGFEQLSVEEESLRTIFKNNKNKQEAVFEIAKYLVKTYNIKTIGARDQTREIYIYSNGIYKNGFSVVKYEIQRILKELVGNHHKKEIIDTIKDLTPVERKSFNPDKNFINLKNGVYDLNTKELLPHDPKHLFFNQVPVVYDKNIDCPQIKKFLSQILDEEYIDIIQEWFGYCLYRNYFIKKAIICVGEKDTGKTTFFKVLQAFLGIENFSGVDLQMISSGRFSLSNLESKHANIYDDLSFEDINDNGTFKMLTGGGFSTAEKKFGDIFQFINYAKLTFSCNKIPNIKDTDDDAFFSRWIIIRFDHKAEKLDKFLIEKITTEEEISGLLNFALEGLYRLLENKDFSYERTVEEIKKEMTMSGSPSAQFIYSELEMVSDPNIFITKDDMHQEFINYVKKNNLPPIGKETLGKNLPKYIKVGNGKKSIKNQDTGKSNQINCWLGVKFKNSKKNETIGPEKKDVTDGLFDFPEG